MSDATPAEVEAVRASCDAFTTISPVPCGFGANGSCFGEDENRPCMRAQIALAALRHPTPARPAPPESEVEAVRDALDALWIQRCKEYLNTKLLTDMARTAIEAADKARAARGVVRQARVLAWAVENFGPVARNRDERAARLAEEAIEVAQAEGVPLEIVKRIAERVYSRPAGALGQEIGGLTITLDALAENAGLDAQAEGDRELARILALPKDWWTRKHAEKVAAGTADLTAAQEPPDAAR